MKIAARSRIGLEQASPITEHPLNGGQARRLKLYTTYPKINQIIPWTSIALAGPSKTKICEFTTPTTILDFHSMNNQRIAAEQYLV